MAFKAYSTGHVLYIRPHLVNCKSKKHKDHRFQCNDHNQGHPTTLVTRSGRGGGGGGGLDPESRANFG